MNNLSCMMSAQDYKEYCVLVRRKEYLEIKASPAYRYRKQDIDEAYADVSGAGEATKD